MSNTQATIHRITDHQEQAAEATRRACETLACTPAELDRRLRLAGGDWGYRDLGERMAEPDWPARLEQAIEEERRQWAGHDARAVRGILAGGPAVFARMAKVDLLGLVDPRLRDFAETYEPERHGGALLVGPTRVGKSAAAAMVVHRVVRSSSAAHREQCLQRGHTPAYQRLHIVWARAIDLATSRQQHPLGRGEAEPIEAAIGASFLVLDDLAWERQTDVASTIAAHRYDRGLPTLTTSGYTVDELSEKYSGAVVRRLIEAGGHDGRVISLFAKG